MDNYTAKGIKLPKTRLGLVKMNKLLDAAEELFTNNGFHSTSISDICKKADTGVSAFEYQSKKSFKISLNFLPLGLDF